MYFQSALASFYSGKLYMYIFSVYIVTCKCTQTQISVFLVYIRRAGVVEPVM